MSAHGTDEHPIHLPQPSFSPPILAFGVMLIALGILVGIPLIVVGLIIFVIGIGTWLVDDARAYAHAGDPTDGAHH